MKDSLAFLSSALLASLNLPLYGTFVLTFSEANLTPLSACTVLASLAEALLKGTLSLASLEKWDFALALLRAASLEAKRRESSLASCKLGHFVAELVLIKAIL